MKTLKLLICYALATAAAGFAQAPTPPYETKFHSVRPLDKHDAPKEEAKAKEIPVHSHYDRGFWFSGGGNTLRVGGDMEIDGRYFLRHSNQESDFRIRRARIYLEGTWQDTFGFLVVPLFTSFDNVFFLQYCYIETLHPKYARLRFGLFKEPFSLEALRSDLLIEFNERSLIIQNFAQIEDYGVMVFGTFWNDKIEYSVGVFNGRGRRFLENNSKKEYVGRVVYAPFLGTHGILDQLYFGASASTSHQFENLNTFVFSTGPGTIFWRWTDVVERGFLIRWDDERTRLGGDFEWFYGSFALRSEFLFVDYGNIYDRPADVYNIYESFYTGVSPSSQNSYISSAYISETRPAYHRRHTHFHAHGGYMEATYILTGEKKERNKWVIPFHPYPCGWGAFEIAARYDRLELSREPLRKGFAIGTSRVDGFVLGVNNYWNAFVEAKIDWFYYRFKDRVKFNKHSIKGESVIIARVQGVY